MDIDTFIKNNELFYGQHDSYSTIIRELLLSYSVKDDLAFFELCMEVLYISPEATDYLDAYLSKPLDEEYYSLAMQSSPAVVSRSETGFNKIVTLPALMDIAYNLGISTENMYLSPKSWNEFGFQGDIFLNKKGNKFFEYRKEGHPQPISGITQMMPATMRTGCTQVATREQWNSPNTGMSTVKPARYIMT